MRIASILLAAGESRRLGTPKQLLRHKGELLIERALRLVSEAGFEPAVVVLGAKANLILDSAQLSAAQVVINPYWQSGIASSIHTGLNALEEDACTQGALSGVLILPCDQLLLSAVHLLRLRQSFERVLVENSRAIAASHYGGVAGIPAIFSCAYLPQLLALTGDEGARKLLRDPQSPVEVVEFEEGLIDVDTPEDLRLLDDRDKN